MEASSIGNSQARTIEMQQRFAKIDEKESVAAGHVFRHEFGYINTVNFSEDSVSIILVDEYMILLGVGSLNLA